MRPGYLMVTSVLLDERQIDHFGADLAGWFVRETAPAHRQLGAWYCERA
jgi:hypothetical protein